LRAHQVHQRTAGRDDLQAEPLRGRERLGVERLGSEALVEPHPADADPRGLLRERGGLLRVGDDHEPLDSPLDRVEVRPGGWPSIASPDGLRANTWWSVSRSRLAMAFAGDLPVRETPATAIRFSARNSVTA
jgi:hypothetical protein